MPWIETLIIAALIGFALVRLGAVPPPHAALLIWIRDGRPRIARGQLRTQALEFIANIIRDADIKTGFIAMTPAKWVAFSPNISSNARQRIRNVLLNL